MSSKKFIITQWALYLLLFILMTSSVDISSAGIITTDHYGERILVSDMKQPVTLEDISAKVSPSLLSTDGKGTWLLNTSIYVINSKLVIDGNNGVKELRFNSGASVAPGTATILSKWGDNPAGNVYISNTKVVTWNVAKDQPEEDYAKMKKIWIDGGSVSDSTFSNINQLQVSGIYSTNVSNINIFDSYSGLRILSSKDLKIFNIRCENISSTGLSLSGVYDSEIYNYVFINDESQWSNPATAADGLLLTNGANNYLHSLDITGPRWGGITLSYGEDNTVIKDIEIRHAGHNGLDLHGNTNTYVENVTITKSLSNNYLFSGTTNMPVGVKNVTLKNCISINPSGRGLVGGSKVSEILIENFTSVGPAETSMQFFNASDICVINLKSDDPNIKSGFNGAYYGSGTNNIRIIDSVLTRASYADIWISSQLCKNNIFINSKYDKQIITEGVDRSYGYYLDMKTISSGGSVLANSQITIDPSVDVISSLDALGLKRSSFTTDAEGWTILPITDRRYSPVLIKRYVDSQGNIIDPYYNVNIHSPSALKGVNLKVTPDSSWYRENPNIPTYTITAVIPDDNTASPNVIGFAPSQENPFVPGESKLFTVWTDEALTDMKWYVDGNLVSSESMKYNWKVLGGSHSIIFEGSNKNGDVTQSWAVSDKSLVPERPVTREPEVSGALTAFTPSVSSFTASSGGSTIFQADSDGQFTSSQWYLNGARVASGTTTYKQDWTTSGSYIMKFEGSTDNRSLSRTWNIVVSGSKYSDMNILPSKNLVGSDETFSLDINIDPKQV